jgi:hypothetical protein
MPSEIYREEGESKVVEEVVSEYESRSLVAKDTAAAVSVHAADNSWLYLPNRAAVGSWHSRS